MKVEFEIVKPDEGSSFRTLYQNAYANEFIWAYHYHPEYELVCVKAGSGTRHVGNHINTFQDGDLVLIGANLPHSGFGLNATASSEQLVLQVKEEVLKGIFTFTPETELFIELLERAKYGILFSGTTKTVITERIFRMRTMSPFEKLIELLNIVQILAASTEYTLLNKQIMHSSTILRHRLRLQKIFTYVEQHFMDELSISDAAALVGISVPSFCNYFKKTTHVTFSFFTNQYRIQRACKLLLQDKTIAEICFDCGFNNVTYFNKIFKQMMHKTPGQFRKECEAVAVKKELQ